jgi:hypothetical protein
VSFSLALPQLNDVAATAAENAPLMRRISHGLQDATGSAHIGHGFRENRDPTCFSQRVSRRARNASRTRAWPDLSV